MAIQFYLDGADKKSIVELAKNPDIAGFTTNPSLMKKSGVTDYKGFCLEILEIVGPKPISFEVFADTLPEMERQAMIIHAWAKPESKLYVKIPVTNSKGESTAPVIKSLTHQGVRLNVTAIFTLSQVWEVCQALKGGAPSIVSVFAGRVADTGVDPMPLMTASAAMCEETGAQVELLWASTREAYNLVQAEQSGCKIITAPLDVLKKKSGFGKNLREMSLDTVKTFKADAESAGFSL